MKKNKFSPVGSLKVIFALAAFAIPLTSIHATPVQAAGLACVDSDGGSDLFTSGTVTTTTQYDVSGYLISTGEVVPDVCLNFDSFTGMWVEGTSGTHIEEATCTDTSTGSITLVVHQCANGCNNGACNAVSSVISPTPTSIVASPVAPASTITTKKVEGKGWVSAIDGTSITINGVVFQVTPHTLVNLNHKASLIVGQKVEYKGLLNSDGSVTLSKFEIK